MIRNLAANYAFRPSRWNELRILSAFRAQRELHAGQTLLQLATNQYRWTSDATGLSVELVRAVVRRWILQEPLRYLRRCTSPGVSALIATLAAKGIKTAVLSDYPAEEKLTALGLSFDYVASATDSVIDSLKPHPHGLEVIANRIKVPVAACLMLGDRRDRDGECAIRAGAMYLLLGTTGRDRSSHFSNFHALQSEVNHSL